MGSLLPSYHFSREAAAFSSRIFLGQCGLRGVADWSFGGGGRAQKPASARTELLAQAQTAFADKALTCTSFFHTKTKSDYFATKSGTTAALRLGPQRRRPLQRRRFTNMQLFGSTGALVAPPGSLTGHVCSPGQCIITSMLGNVFLCSTSGELFVLLKKLFDTKAALESLSPGSRGLSSAEFCAGSAHICDRTCRYRRPVSGGTVCKLTRLFFPWTPESHAGHKRKPSGDGRVTGGCVHIGTTFAENVCPAPRAGCCRVATPAS